jgi:acrylyl-CoA reductase (NADPH)
MTFRALQVNKGDNGVAAQLVSLEDQDLMEGEVTVAVEYSTVNYKDALAVSGKAPIVQVFPLIGGIDLAAASWRLPAPRSRPATRCWSMAGH